MKLIFKLNALIHGCFSSCFLLVFIYCFGLLLQILVYFSDCIYWGTLLNIYKDQPSNLIVAWSFHWNLTRDAGIKGSIQWFIYYHHNLYFVYSSFGIKKWFHKISIFLCFIDTGKMIRVIALWSENIYSFLELGFEL